jgi:hypothetical protein
VEILFSDATSPATQPTRVLLPGSKSDVIGPTIMPTGNPVPPPQVVVPQRMVMPSSKSLIVNSSPEQIEQIRKVIRAIESERANAPATQPVAPASAAPSAP